MWSTYIGIFWQIDISTAHASEFEIANFPYSVITPFPNK